MKTYKKRNIYVILSTFFLFILIYFISIRKTFELKNTIETYKSDYEDVKNAPFKIALIERNLELMENKMNRYFFDKGKNQEYIMELVSKFCDTHKLILKEFPQLSVQNQGNIDLETTIISVQGNYINLLELIYYFEQDVKIGRVSSVIFAAATDFKSKEKSIVCTIYLQNIRKKI